jgi:hypothetical protein
MEKAMTKLIAALIIAVIAGYGLHAWAQARIDARPTMTAIGTSSSNGVSFAWFFDPQNRMVYLCRADQAAAPDCRATAGLP